MDTKRVLAFVVILIITITGCNIISKQDTGYLHERMLKDNIGGTIIPPSSRTSLFGGKKIVFTESPLAFDTELRQSGIVPLPSVLVQKAPSVASGAKEISKKAAATDNTSISNVCLPGKEKEELSVQKEEMAQEVSALPDNKATIKSETPSLIKYYEVQKGDSLWSIAGKDDIYDNHYKWLEVYNANKDKIDNPNVIYPGQMFIIPQYDQMTETQAASPALKDGHE